jgi:hypothetical protein
MADGKVAERPPIRSYPVGIRRSTLFCGSLLVSCTLAACMPAMEASPEAAPVVHAPAPAPPPPPAPSPPLAPPATAPAPAPAPPPPWSAAPLAAESVSRHYLEQWRRAENRARCAPIAPADPGVGHGATPRAATFAGGWAVAYDRPGLRSAFGIAGTGSSAAEEPGEYRWPHQRIWADGSRAGYGPEGGTGPNELAYLRIEGQDCLYNVWSRLGRDHLEHLLEQLRFVAVPRQ